MSRRIQAKSRIKVSKPVFHVQDKKADDEVLTKGLIKSAKRSGQLSLCNRGLGMVPENVWKLDELVLEETKDVDFNRSETSSWWNSECLKTLDLSSNAIKTISTDVKLLQSLVTLKLHDNALTELPAEFGSLKTLENLSLDHNKLTLLPKQFYQLTELRWLSISHNFLQMIEPDFGDLVMLTFLVSIAAYCAVVISEYLEYNIPQDLSHNKLSSLPPGMGYLVRLAELKLAHNQLQELPPDIVNLRELKKLDLSNNNLKALPAMGELRRLEFLDANHNDIEALPDFYGCAALRDLHLANNYIKEITEDFCEQMQHMQVLNVRDNKIEILPENISLLKNLKRLDITNNSLNKLPQNLGLLSQLQSIGMEGNRLSAVRPDVLRAGAGRVLKYLRDRVADEVAAEARLTEDQWPDKFTLKKTQALILSGRELEAVPAGVLQAAAAAQVYLVDLSRNKLTALPAGLPLVADSLTQLVLTGNRLTQLDAVAALRRLQLLELGGNQLSQLPPALAGLTQLRELVISNNKFKSIPSCVYSLEALEILLAADNQVEEVDASTAGLGALPKLAVLDLTNNSITRVPPELGAFTNLRSLEIMGNPFRQPRHAILEKGTASILSYLRDRMPPS